MVSQAMLRGKMWLTMVLCLEYLLLEVRDVCGNGVVFPGSIASKREVEPESGKRIVGGDDATIDEFPYQVSLRVRGSHFCGGSIISNSYVMTAAHCARATRARIAAYGGSNDLRAMGQPHYVIRRIVHENYRASKEGVPVNDIALLAVAPPLLGSNQQPVSLPQQGQSVAAGTMAVVTGWGTTEESGSVSRILQKVNVPILAKDECKRLLSGLVQNFQICAGYPDTGGKDSCQGDSGGPLVANGQQVGIVSWGNGCARKGFPGVYTEVAAYRNWITSKTGI